MSENPQNPKLTTAIVAGGVLAALGVGIFVLLFFVLLSDMDNLPRLLLSMCLPPALMALVVGAYFIISANKPEN